MDVGLHVLREYALVADGERGALIGCSCGGSSPVEVRQRDSGGSG